MYCTRGTRDNTFSSRILDECKNLMYFYFSQICATEFNELIVGNLNSILVCNVAGHQSKVTGLTIIYTPPTASDYWLTWALLVISCPTFWSRSQNLVPPPCERHHRPLLQYSSVLWMPLSCPIYYFVCVWITGFLAWRSSFHAHIAFFIHVYLDS